MTKNRKKKSQEKKNKKLNVKLIVGNDAQKFL